MLNHFEEIRLKKPYRLPPGFVEATSMSKPGTGQLVIYQNSKSGEFMISKPINSNSLDKRKNVLPYFAKIMINLDNVMPFMGFDENSPRNQPNAIFKFSPDILRVMHDKFTKEKSIVPEKLIIKVYKEIIAARAHLENQGLYHPFISMDNIFLLNGKFCLTSPFAFDSFYTELIEISNVTPREADARVAKKASDNNVQLGFTLLQLASLATDEQIRNEKGYIKDNMRECLRITNNQYSPESTKLIEQLIKGRDNSSRGTSPMNTLNQTTNYVGGETIPAQSPMQGFSTAAPLPEPIPISRKGPSYTGEPGGRMLNENVRPANINIDLLSSDIDFNRSSYL